MEPERDEMRRSDMEERAEELAAPGRPGEILAEGDGRTESEREGVGTAPRRAPREPAAQDDELEEISLLELANVLLRRWKFVLGFPIAAAVIAAIISLILPPKYTAQSVFFPEQEATGLELPAGVAGLAAQFGVSIPSGAGASPQFYADVIGSRTLRDQVLEARYVDPKADTQRDSATLLDILRIKGESELERLEIGRERLESMISVEIEPTTNVVELSVETRYPALSASVANTIIDLLSRFNLETRQSNARANRRFAESRMAQAEEELREAEEVLKRFLEQNRRFESSPELTFQHERLQRQVRIKEEVLTSLRRSYEEARIQEVKDTPVITVIDRAVPPQEKSSPKRKLNVILAFLVGGVLGVFGAFGSEFVERARTRNREEYEELTSRWQAIRSELKSLFRRTRRDRG